MEWYLHCIRNYANFKGRARRKEYWMFLLFNILFTFLLSVISGVLAEFFETEFFGFIILIYFLFIIVPHFAVVVRRLHDTGRSGFYWFVRFIPIIGFFWLLIILIEDSKYGPNKWGSNPKGIGDDAIINEIGIPLEDE